MNRKEKRALLNCGCLLLLFVLFAGGFAILRVVNPRLADALSPSETETSTPESPKPTPSPTPKLSFRQRVEADTKEVLNNISDPLYGELKSVVYSEDSKTVTIKYYISANAIWDHGHARNMIKINCFSIEKAVWESNIAHKSTNVMVIIQSDLTDQYGKSKIDDMGNVDLSTDTAHKFNWDGLNFNSAWDVYDSTWLLPNLFTNG